jgi:hypothetical protein
MSLPLQQRPSNSRTRIRPVRVLQTPFTNTNDARNRNQLLSSTFRNITSNRKKEVIR